MVEDPSPKHGALPQTPSRKSIRINVNNEPHINK
jgi:hypothetical protein